MISPKCIDTKFKTTLGGELMSTLFTCCPHSVKNEIPPQDGGHLHTKLTNKMPIMNIVKEDSNWDDILDIQLIFEINKKKSIKYRYTRMDWAEHVKMLI